MNIQADRLDLNKPVQLSQYSLLLWQPYSMSGKPDIITVSHLREEGRRKKKVEHETEKADVLLWQHHFSGSWDKESKILSTYRNLLRKASHLHLKQWKKSTQILNIYFAHV